MRTLQAALRKSHEARTHRARITCLRAVVGYIPAPTPDPVQAVADTVAAAMATAPPLADVPFSLQPTRSTRTPKQESLF
jgi:hypothetical protein